MQSNDNDDFTTWLLVCFIAVTLGPGLLAKFVPAAAQLLVRVHVLVTSGILIPIGTAGLDLPRVLLLAGATLLVALIAIWSIKRRMRLRASVRGRA